MELMFILIALVCAVVGAVVLTIALIALGAHVLELIFGDFIRKD